MPNNDEQAFEINDVGVSMNSETSSLLEQISKIQEEIKKLYGSLPNDFDEKAFMDEGWGE